MRDERNQLIASESELTPYIKNTKAPLTQTMQQKTLTSKKIQYD